PTARRTIKNGPAACRQRNRFTSDFPQYSNPAAIFTTKKRISLGQPGVTTDGQAKDVGPVDDSRREVPNAGSGRGQFRLRGSWCGKRGRSAPESERHVRAASCRRRWVKILGGSSMERLFRRFGPN